MKTLLLILIFLGISIINFGQQRSDSLTQKRASAVQVAWIDSPLQPLPDSLLPAFQKIDSIRNDFNLAADSLQTKHQEAIGKIDAEANKLNGTIDSLQRVQLPTKRYTKRLDSVNALRQKVESKFTSSLSALKAKTTDKLDALDLPPEYKAPLQELTRSINDLNPGIDVMKIPELKIPGYQLPDIDGIGDLASKAKEIGEIDNIAKLPDIKRSTRDLGQVTQQAQAYKEDLRNITEGNLNDIEKLPETIEQQATKIEGIDELQKQSGLIGEPGFSKLTDSAPDELGGLQVEDFKDPAKGKEKAVAMAKKAAVNHFAGRKEQLKSAMEKISKYKQKYSSVSSIKDLPKRPPNPMKGKPFIQRLVPGFYLQYQQKDYYLLDVNPYIGYKLSGRFTAGLGWNHRYKYDKDNRSFNSRSRIFGPRGYIDFKLGKGFIAHLEGESMNTFVPSTLRGNPDNGHREWVESFMTGIKKEYKIYKNLKGTALIQYNLFNRYYKAPYVDRLNSRVGFEYVLKSKANKK